MEPQGSATTINNTKAATATTNTKRHILTIPAEIRLLIYETYFSTYQFDNSKPQPALIHTCKLLREEALKAYEARLIIIKNDRTSKFQKANAALQQRIDACAGHLGSLSLRVEQMELELEGHAAIMDVQFELGKVHSLKCGFWLKSPRKKVSVSYMKGVKILQPK